MMYSPFFNRKLYSYLMQMGSLTENKGISSILFIKLICTNPFLEVSVSNIRVSSSHGNKLENTVNTITIYHKNPQLSSNYSTIASQLLTVKESVCKKKAKNWLNSVIFLEYNRYFQMSGVKMLRILSTVCLVNIYV